MNHSLLVRVVMGRIYPRRFKKAVVVVKKDANFLLPIITVIQDDLFDIKQRDLLSTSNSLFLYLIKAFQSAEKRSIPFSVNSWRIS
jgi:hypothetical protein